MKKPHALPHCITAAALSLALLLSLSACGAQPTTAIGNDSAASSDPSQTETALAGEALLEKVFTQNVPDDRGRVSYYRDKVTDVLYMDVFCRSATGYAGAGGLTVMLDPDTGKPLTYTRYMEMYSTLNS